MSDDRKCPLCGAGYTHFGWTWGDDELEGMTWVFERQECVNKDCKLPCRLWDQIERLQRDLDEARAKLQVPTEVAKPFMIGEDDA